MTGATLQDGLTRLEAALCDIARPGATDQEISNQASVIFLRAWPGVPALPPDDMPAGQFEPDEWRVAANRKIAVNKVEAIAEKARALRDTFERAPGNVHLALLSAAREKNKLQFYTGLQPALDAFIDAYDEIAPIAARLLPEHAPAPVKGPKTNSHAYGVAEDALAAYEALSGKRAARHSEGGSIFVPFLANVFSILNISFEADTAAREAIKRRRVCGNKPPQNGK